MSKYGLNLRPKPKKQPPKPLLPKILGFGNDDDEDIEKEISRQATKNKSLRDIEEQQRKALEEDPSAFDYDGVYDEMKTKTVQPKTQDREERKPKYIQNLLIKAEKRQKEQEIVYERKLAKERSQEDHLYADKDKFVTSAYKRKLAEQAKWLEEERLRQLKEEKDDVTKKTDLSDFYFNLGKNVAFGAKDVEARKPVKPVESRTTTNIPEDRDESAETSDKNRPQKDLDSFRDSESKVPSSEEIISPRKRNPTEPDDSKPVSGPTESDNSPTDQPPVEPPKPPPTNHHKRSEDTVAAAKERFLARKRAKEQYY